MYHHSLDIRSITLCNQELSASTRQKFSEDVFLKQVIIALIAQKLLSRHNDYITELKHCNIMHVGLRPSKSFE